MREDTAPVDATSEPPKATALEEIVVTAERRQASLQDTPISIEAFNREAIELRNIKGVQDLGGNVPGLTIEPFPTHNATLRVFIRGVGINDAQLTQDPAVGIYMDGVYIARSVGLALDVADLDRIEVLRGPQGTLYGRNTTGGAVNLITKRPTPGAFSMSLQGSGASRENYFARGSFNIPVSDELAFGASVLGSSRDGFVENTGPGGDYGDREEFAGRFAARWTPTYWLTADYAYDRSDMNYYNLAFQPVSLPTTNKGQAELFKPYAISQSVYSTERLESLATGAPLEESGTRIDGHSLTLTMPFDGMELKYIGAWRDLTDRQYADLGGGGGSTTYRLDSNAYDGPAADVANGGPTPLVIPTVTQTQWSHELQLLGTLFDDSVDYVLGAYYFSEEGREDRHRLNHQLSSAISLNQLDELSPEIPELGAILDLLAPLVGVVDQVRLVNFVDLDWTIDNEATALFGQFTWTPGWDALEDRLHLTAGYRHSEDKRTAVKSRISESYIEINQNGLGTAVPLPASEETFDNVHASREFSDDALSLVAAFDLSKSLNVYVKSVESYKSGGFNVRDPNVSGATADPIYGIGYTDGFAPEYVESIEAGIKSEWFARRLRLNAAVYDADYTDMQINFLIPGSISDTKVINAGKARMRGVDLDITAMLTPDLVVLADYAYLDARVLEALDPNGENQASLYPFTSAPRHSGSAAIDWTAWRGDWGDLRAFISYTYTSLRNGTVISEERRGLTSIPAYGLWNARITAGNLRFGQHGSLDVALYGRNLADEIYPLMAIDNVPHANRAVAWGDPRSVGLDLIYRFE
ncbi:MAG: TonB-dependent receptor [Pseudomonadota bacterium]|nr:TonB-dependent receptor [Pseudomonadota bacterium]